MSSLSLAAFGAAADAVDATLSGLVGERFASRLFDRDPTLWGEAAREESAKRLGWVDLHRTSRPLVGEITALRETLHEQGVDRILLAGMGGSSLAPEVICAVADVPLVVLDSSDPHQVRDAVQTDRHRTALVVSSKSGATVETDSQRRAFIGALEAVDLDPAERIIVVTDPGSPLEQQSREAGYRVFTADPEVGGRYSALTAFGLVPSGLAGVDIGGLLDQAAELADLLAEDERGNPALTLGAAIAATSPLRNKLVISDHQSGLVGFGDWAEQLIAESTGKNGTGLLPVLAPGEAGLAVLDPAHDVTRIALVAEDTRGSSDDHDCEDVDLDDSAAANAASLVVLCGSLGGQFLLWEAATAVAGRLLGINPFDQPDVESAKQAARDLMAESGGAGEVDGVQDGAVIIRDGAGANLAEAVDAVLAQIDPDQGYLAIQVYLDRLVYADFAEVVTPLTVRTSRPVTFGWGPRFLHSTGQFHKGGPPIGVFVQVTGDPVEDLEVPGRDYTFGDLIAAQAGGDAAVLVEHGRPVLRLHLTDVEAGLTQLAAVLGVETERR